MPPNLNNTSGPRDAASLDQAHSRIKRLALILCSIILCFLLLSQVLYILYLGNGLSIKVDSFAESNALRAGEKFSIHGFRIHYGLPDICYGEQFPHDGALGKERSGHERVTEWVYTHYPPGPDYMAGVLTDLFGVGRLTLFRLWPITVGMACIVFFTRSLWLTFGPGRAAAILAGCAAAPMFSNMMHGLHYQGYAFALLLAQWGVMLGLLTRSEGPRKRSLVALLLMGFVQGWLSFDYVFLVCLSALPFWLWRRLSASPLAWRRLIICVACPTAGFVLAHALHFIQVAFYFGSFNAALKDYFEAASYRMLGEVYGGRTDLLWVLLNYMQGLALHPKFFLTNLLAACGLVLFLSLFPAGWSAYRVRSLELTIDWKVNRSNLWPLLAALLVSGLWTMTMPNHAGEHFKFIPRHYFLFYFFCLIFVVQSLRPCYGFKEPNLENLSFPSMAPKLAVCRKRQQGTGIGYPCNFRGIYRLPFRQGPRPSPNGRKGIAIL